MIRLLCLLLFIFFCAGEATAEQPARLALLIGNQSYASAVGTLRNPLQDVALIGASLKKLGFTVTVLNDAGYRTMDVALKRYRQSFGARDQVRSASSITPAMAPRMPIHRPIT